MSGDSLSLLDGVQHDLRVGDHRHRICLLVDAVFQVRIVPTRLLYQRNDLCGLLLTQDCQFERQLLAVTCQLVFAPLRRQIRTVT